MTTLLSLAKAGRRVDGTHTELAAWELVSAMPTTARRLRTLPLEQQSEYITALVDIAERGRHSKAAIEIGKLTTSK